MFNLIEQPVNEPELTQREKAAIEDAQRWTARKIEDAVYTRMRDPAYVIDALQICLSDNLTTQEHLAELIIGHGDRGVHIANIKMDVMNWITHQVTKEAERYLL
jgi:hypothetical protein